MKVLNILSSGGVGGIQVLCKYISMYAEYDNTFCLLFGEGPIYEEMRSNGATVVSLADRSGRKNQIGKIHSLLKLVDQHDIVVTHHASISTQFIFAVLRALRPHKKYVMTAHSCFEKETYYIYGGLKDRLYAVLLRHNLHKSDCVIFVSEAGKKSYMREFTINEKKTRVIYNGVPISETMPSIEKRPHKPLQIVYIGRLVEVKGVQLLIDAVSKLKAEGMGIELTIVGDGTYRGSLEKQVGEKDICEIVRFEGQQTDIARYLSRSDVFVYPSVWQEVFGISIVEALSYGIPSVANRVGGIPEIIEDGINGALSDEMTGQGIADAIIKVADLYKKFSADELGDKCRSVAERFDIKKTVAGLEKLYQSLL